MSTKMDELSEMVREYVVAAMIEATETGTVVEIGAQEPKEFKFGSDEALKHMPPRRANRSNKLSKPPKKTSKKKRKKEKAAAKSTMTDQMREVLGGSGPVNEPEYVEELRQRAKQAMRAASALAGGEVKYCAARVIPIEDKCPMSEGGNSIYDEVNSWNNNKGDR